MTKYLGEIIKEYRKIHRLSMDSFSEKSGLSKPYISMLEKNYNPKSKKKIIPTIDTISKCAKAMNMDFDELFNALGTQTISTSINHSINIHQNTMHNRTNVIGVVPAGVPLEAIEDIIGEIEYPSRFEDKEVFALQIKGDSMNKVLPDGSIGLFEKTDVLENGQIGAILVNGYDATVKKFYRLTDSYVLEPLSFNPDYQPIVIKDGTDPVSIVGKLLWYCSKESLM